jgi:hypothetical protein
LCFVRALEFYGPSTWQESCRCLCTFEAPLNSLYFEATVYSFVYLFILPFRIQNRRDIIIPCDSGSFRPTTCSSPRTVPSLLPSLFCSTFLQNSWRSNDPRSSGRYKPLGIPAALFPDFPEVYSSRYGQRTTFSMVARRPWGRNIVNTLKILLVR